MNSLQQIIGKNLADIRKKRGLSLDQTAELTGVSKAMLAQIEKGNTNPTVTTLWKIANGLNVSFSTFMKEKVAQVTQIKKDQLQPLIDDQGNYLVYSLFPFHPDKKFEIFFVELEPGFTHEADQHNPICEEYVLVSEGELTVEVKGEEYLLHKGEALHFQAKDRHLYKNTTEQITTFFVVIYYSE
ncbi:helix-turn-helix domain-containing protein [Bacillus sp. FJAT-42315]|uniref:helix-turn-helix domain-containing protein n=1 Tax=Bacillus sp. FJAT-42315 TaxID=2014077 RepID=UPI000C236A9F|nr:helix-turn-helix domain-containing protein [Bacillus sp. FJAT-42315]